MSYGTFKNQSLTWGFSGKLGNQIVLRKGACTPGASGIYWHYKAVTDTGNTEGLTVRAIARDFPGNRTEMAVIM